jgi:hypothetical protein
MAITFVGGTAAQQQLVTTAHGNAAAAITQAAAQAAQGAGAFATWFGPATPFAVQSAVLVYGAMRTFMTGTAFTYDLTQTPESRRAQDAYLNVPAAAAGTITLTVWKDFWNTFQTDSVSIRTYLALSVVYVASLFGSYGVVRERAEVLNADDATFLATYRPGDAILSPLNYMYYAGTYLPTS